jgi:hypothetical protein
MKIYKHHIRILLLVAMVMANLACQQASKAVSSPKDYDLSEGEKFVMPDELIEISGIAFQNLDPKVVYSIQDEDGRVYSQKWGIKKSVDTKFGTKGDYEDLAILKDQIFVLKSNGHVYGFAVSETTKDKAEGVQEWKEILPKGEYEGLYADQSGSKLYVLCKNCELDKKKPQSTGYILDYNPASKELAPSGTFIIHTDEIASSKQNTGKNFRPSAISQNPVTKSWYILSSVNKVLVVLDQKWSVTSVYHLDSGKFNQPEGLAFDQAQNLYISNEGDEITNGNILRFKFRPAE